MRGLRQGSRRNKSLARIIWGWLLFILILIMLIFVGIHITGQLTEVIGSSMYPTLEEGDKVLVDRISYRFVNPSRYDIVIFPFAYQDDVFYIKRIIGLPGETIQISEGAIYINGVKLQEPFSFDPIESAGVAFSQITLGEDEYFVLGDNRNDSVDSRQATVGNVRRSEMIGRALARVEPLSSFSLLFLK